jgi:hypothetical protein
MLNLLRRLAGRSTGGSEAQRDSESAADADGSGPDALAPLDAAMLEPGVPEPPAEPEAPPVEPVPCPYCAFLMSPPPPRTRRCPSCRQQVIVRRLDGAAVYLTETAAAVLEAQRRREADEKAWTASRQHWLALAKSVRAPADLVRQVAEMPLTERAVDGARAVYRTAADQAVREARQGEHWVQVERLRSAEAEALYEDLGRPVPPPDDIIAVYREAKAAVLHSLAAHSPVAELAGSSCCKACRADDGELCSIATELRRPRLPHPDCPRGLCDCDWFVAVPEPKGTKKRRRRKPASAPTAPEA